MLKILWERPGDPELQQYLSPTEFCEPDHPEIQEVTAEVIKEAKTPKEAAVKTHLFVRDEIKFHMTAPKPSIEVLQTKLGWCWTKANLQVAMLRAARIPARYRAEPFLPFFLALEVAEEFWEFIWGLEAIHGLAEVYLDGKWIGCDATTDKDLIPSTLRFDWDGEHDLTTMLPWRKSIAGTPSTCPVKELNEAFESIPPGSYDFMNEHMDAIRALPDDKKYGLYLEVYGKAIMKYLEFEAQKWRKWCKESELLKE
jgi:hypothetical protein